MSSNKLVAIFLFSVCGFGVALSGRAQSPPSTVTSACHVSPIVSDLDKSARFYRDVIGLDLVPVPGPGPLPWDADPGHLKLHGLPRARLRFVGAALPGRPCGGELAEFGGAVGPPVPPRGPA